MPTQKKAEAPTRDDDKDLEHVIEAIRLGNIEKEIRSNTSILDVRKVYPVEEVLNPRTVERDALKAKKVLSRRANANNEGDIRVQGALARARLEEQGVVITSARDAFEHEELIWKNKAHSSNYHIKRKFDNPQLHAFAKSLDNTSRKSFEHLSKENLYRMSQGLRDAVGETKRGMDRLGIFHPEVNAHRASSQYLIKLYRGINTDNVEDIALKALQEDMKRREELEDERREIVKSAGSDKRGDLPTPSSAKRDASSREPSSRATSTRNLFSSGNSRPDSSKALTRPASSRRSTPTASSRPSSGKEPKQETAPGNEGNDNANTSASAAVAMGGLFKSKYKAAGTSDPRKILEEEASRLQNSRSGMDKRPLADGKIGIVTLEDKASETLLRPIKAGQLAGAAGVRKQPTNIRQPLHETGKPAIEHAPTEEEERAQVWKEIVELNESLPKLNADNAINEVEYRYIFSKAGTVPQHIMTFDDFQSIFQQHQSTSTAAVAELKRLEKGGVQNTAESDPSTKGGRPGLLRANSSNAPAVTESFGPTQPTAANRVAVEPVDTIQTMQQTDQRFKAFRELQMREKDFKLQEAIKKKKESRSLRMSENANRRTSRLGVKAVFNMLDSSRGGESKGFVNVFGDPSFRKEDMVDRSELLAIGGVSGAYDENGRKLEKSNSSMGPRVMSRMSSKLPYYSTFEIKKMTEEAPDDQTNASSVDNDDYLSQDSGQFPENVLPGGRTSGNYPPLGPLTDETKSPLKIRNNLGEKVQGTILKVWDLLNTPTFRRVEFMAKYSTHSYFSSLQDAINLWAQCACYCSARVALITMCRNIQQNENIPVSTNAFLGIIDEVVNATVVVPLLPKVKNVAHTSVADAYLQRRRSTFHRIQQPPDIKMSLRTVFTSALFLEHFNMSSSILEMKAAAESSFSADAESRTMESAKEKATNFFKSIQRHIDQNIISVSTEALVDLDDIIPFGSSSCRDWVAHTKYPALSKKKKKTVAMNSTTVESDSLTAFSVGDNFFDSPAPTRPPTPGDQLLLERTSTPSLMLI